MIRLGILGSTRGSMLLPLHKAIAQGDLNAEIAIVLSNKADALILENAKKCGLQASYVDVSQSDESMTIEFLKARVDVVVLIGYMRILSKTFVNTWKNNIINVHPSLLPAFSGKMDKQVHQAVLDAKVKETGCTVHRVTEEVDAGPVILQKKCKVEATDTVESLRARVQSLESVALIEAIRTIIGEA